MKPPPRGSRLRRCALRHRDDGRQLSHYREGCVSDVHHEYDVRREARQDGRHVSLCHLPSRDDRRRERDRRRLTGQCLHRGHHHEQARSGRRSERRRRFLRVHHHARRHRAGVGQRHRDRFVRRRDRVRPDDVVRLPGHCGCGAVQARWKPRSVHRQARSHGENPLRHVPGRIRRGTRSQPANRSGGQHLHSRTYTVHRFSNHGGQFSSR